MYVRVNVVEFKSEDAMEKALSIYRDKSAKWIKDAQLLLTMKTSDRSALYYATFKTEQAAENAMEGRKKYIDAMSDLVHDVFSHEGDLDFAYMHEDFLSAKILQRNF